MARIGRRVLRPAPQPAKICRCSALSATISEVLASSRRMEDRRTELSNTYRRAQFCLGLIPFPTNKLSAALSATQQFAGLFTNITVTPMDGQLNPTVSVTKPLAGGFFDATAYQFDGQTRGMLTHSRAGRDIRLAVGNNSTMVELSAYDISAGVGVVDGRQRQEQGLTIKKTF